jgi:hypothetical protein
MAGIFSLAILTPVGASGGWSIVSSPNIGTSINDLLGLSCFSAVSCNAVGLYFNTSLDAYQSLIESWNGTTWSIVPSPDNGTAYNVLPAVSCRLPAGSCTAVGDFYNTNLGVYQNLIDSRR